MVRNSHVTAVQPHRVLLVVFNFQTQFENISSVFHHLCVFGWIYDSFFVRAELHPNGQSGCVVMSASTKLVSEFYGYTKYSFKKNISKHCLGSILLAELFS